MEHIPEDYLQPTFDLTYDDDLCSPYTLQCSVDVMENGIKLGSAIAESKLKVWCPYYFYGHNIGTQGYDPSAANATLITTAPSQNPGISFTSRVVTPAFFNELIGYGSASNIQICDLNKTYTSSGWNNHTIVSGWSLDNSFPYNNWYGADDTEFLADDSPNLGLLSSLLQWTSSYKIDDNYYMFLAYCPPESFGSTGSSIVSLMCKHWKWTTHDERSNWNASWPGPYGSVRLDSEIVHGESIFTWNGVFYNIE